MGQLPATIELTDDKIDDVLEMICDAKHYKEIAEKYNVKLWKLFKFLHSDKFSARVREAKEYAASVLIDEAERVLAQAKDDYKLMAVARELAHHYRWKASMINRKEYGQHKPIEPAEQDSHKKEVIIRVIEE